jgi:hypothetical protein
MFSGAAEQPVEIATGELLGEGLSDLLVTLLEARRYSAKTLRLAKSLGMSTLR